MWRETTAIWLVYQWGKKSITRSSSFVLDELLTDRTFHELVQILGNATFMELIMAAFQHDALVLFEILLVSVEELCKILLFEILDTD